MNAPSPHDGRHIVVKVERDELAVTESAYAPGTAGAGSHFHKQQVDCFYVLEGEMTFRTGDDTVRLGPGEFIALLPGVVHSFENGSDVPARFLNVHAPGRFVLNMRKEVAALRAAGKEPDRSFLERHDVFQAD